MEKAASEKIPADVLRLFLSDKNALMSVTDSSAYFNKADGGVDLRYVQTNLTRRDFVRYAENP